MEVVLFYPSPRIGKAAQERIELPQGLLSIATPLDLDGYKVTIIDQRVDDDWEDDLARAIKRKPVCFGVSSMSGPQIRYGLEASRMVKELGTVPVVWGGVHPTLLPAQTVENENIDIVVEGEGDETFPELVRALEKGATLKGILGVWYKENGEIRGNPLRPYIDLNAQPPLSYHLVDVERYLIDIFGVKHLSLSTSRGCPYRCTFCYNTAFYQKTWRGLTSEAIIERLGKIKQDYGIKGIVFTDDLFLINKKRAREVFEGIREAKLDIICSKLDLHGNELDDMDDDFLKLLEGCGCKTLVVGVESGSERILKLLKKDIEISRLVAYNRRVRKFDIVPTYFFMAGFPTETKGDIAETVSLMLKLLDENPNAVKSINLYTPYPGTELFDLAVKNGFEAPKRLEDWVSLNWRTVNRAMAPWIDRDTERLLKMLHCSSLFVEKRRLRDPFKKTHPLVVLLARLYYPIAKWRVKNLYSKYLLEVKIAEWLGLYRRQL